MFNPHLDIGQCINNDDIRRIFKCGNMGGMRRSHTTGTLVIVSDYTKGLYHDKWIGGVLHYTGMGKTGDQDLYWSQNATHAKSSYNGVDVHLFEVMNPGEYVYCGRVELVAQPYADTQPDENGTPRRVWMFPVRPLPDNDVKKPSMFVFKDMVDYQANGKNVDAEYARQQAAKDKTKSPVPRVVDYKVQGPKTYENAPEDIVGKSLKHKAYGAGKIVSVKGSMMTVSFPTVGEKTLNYEVCTEKHLVEFIG